jgi:formylglycine-generating enzyme required for sulfatase activity
MRDPASRAGLWRSPALETELPAWSRPDNNYEPLPPPPGTGWEETTLLAAAMARADETEFLRELTHVDPILAGRCLLQPGVGGDAGMRQAILGELLQVIARPEVALRVRIAAADMLGALGDPRPGEMVLIPAGRFRMGEGREQHEVTLADYRIGKYPVTNAEYRRFIDARGYREKR